MTGDLPECCTNLPLQTSQSEDPDQKKWNGSLNPDRAQRVRWATI